jgi:hypothetical protein
MTINISFPPGSFVGREAADEALRDVEELLQAWIKNHQSALASNWLRRREAKRNDDCIAIYSLLLDKLKPVRSYLLDN